MINFSRLFWLVRDVDVTGVSGTGVVAEGVEFSDGCVALRWMSRFPTSVVFHERGLAGVEAVHGHNGATRIVFDLPPAVPEPPSNIPPYTSHGHPTGATIPAGTPRPTSVARCGGPALCRVCARQAGRVTLSRADPVDGALDSVRRRTCPSWPGRCACDPAILDVPALPPDTILLGSTDGGIP